MRYQKSGFAILDTLAVPPAITAFDPDEPTLQGQQFVIDYKAWLAAGNVPDPDPQDAVRARKQTLAALVNAVQTVLDSTANAYGYDSCERAITYQNDPNPAYAAEGQAFLAWRSAVWTYGQSVEANVLAGKQAVPAADQLIAGLPALKLPPPSLPVV